MRGFSLVVRTEGGTTGGLGHIRRSMALAHELRRRGVRIVFVVNSDEAAMSVLERSDFEVVPADASDEKDLSATLSEIRRVNARGVLIDSYRIRDLSPLQEQVPFVGVVDDLADRRLTADLVVNGAVNAASLSYDTVPHTKLLLGPRYALLREAFEKPPNRQFKSHLERVLITVGGADGSGLTVLLIQWCRRVFPAIRMDVVSGPFFGDELQENLKKLQSADPLIHLHADPLDMYALMVGCDLAITGGGQTTYELAATGTPAVAIRVADNQTGSLRGLWEQGTLCWVGDASDPGLAENVMRTLIDLYKEPRQLELMGSRGRQLVDGQGVKRVAQVIVEACCS